MKTVTLLTLCFVVVAWFPSAARAADGPSSLTANQMYESFFNDVGTKFKTATFDFKTGIFFQKYKNDTVPSTLTRTALKNGETVALVSAESKGATQLSGSYPDDAIMESTLTTYDKAANIANERDISFVTLQEGMYIKFKSAKDSTLKNQWTAIPYHGDAYMSLRDALSQELMDVSFVAGGMPMDANIIRATRDLLPQLNLFSFKGKPTAEKINGRDTVRYNLVFNKDAVLEYWKKVSNAKQFVYNERGNSQMPWLGSYNLRGESYLDYYAKNSVVSFWFDKETLLPVRFAQFNAAPTKDGKLLYSAAQDWTWSNVNKPMVPIRVPSPLVPYDPLIQKLGLVRMSW